MLADGWLNTGDVYVEEEGCYTYQGRADDMFKAAGYRIGPSEIENCLIKHPAVANAAVVPKPDAERGAVVPVGVTSAIPETESIAIRVEKNPNMLVASLDIPAGTAVRLEPGQKRTVQLIPLRGARKGYGFQG